MFSLHSMRATLDPKARRSVRLVAAWFAALALVAPATLNAWNAQGHRLVALVATNHLTPAARQQVQILLGDETLADVAVWADRYLLGNNQTSFWHYVNIPPDAASYEDGLALARETKDDTL